MNLLKNETSPYLLQHAHNPVHWFPWGEMAFKKATEEQKPVLVSIGYSSCHWCHVMEHESFEDEETAQLMNNLFINIKVDREEYPDVDNMYMDAVQAMTGSGGWPLNVFLTADKKPFYGGTYFPSKRMHNRASWKETLINVSQFFTQNNNEVELQANKLMTHLLTTSSQQQFTNEEEIFSTEVIDTCTKKILAQADIEWGGFGTSPKFPSTFSLNFLLDNYLLNKNEIALQHVVLSLDKMRMGGIKDHLIGGFSRYSTDKYWIAPHFEKMLYDNALLIELYAKTYFITKKDNYKQVVEQTFNWLQSEMMSQEYGFYSAQDADSEGIEGKYYTWAYHELKEILKDDFVDFCNYYSIEKEGNWEQTNILFTTKESVINASPKFLNNLLKIHKQLIEIRNKRIKPLTDDKILLSWNALMNRALTKVSLYLSDEKYLTIAEKNMEFLLTNFQSEKFLYFHTYKNNTPKIAAYLDDLVLFTDALLEISKATANAKYLLKAKEIVEHIFQNFHTKNNWLLDFTNHNTQQVVINKQEIYDGAMPSSNAIFCKAVYELGYIFQNQDWINFSTKMLQTLITHVKKYPTSFSVWANEIQNRVNPVKEIKIVGENAKNYYQQLYNNITLPNVIYIVSNENEEKISSLRSVKKEGETLLYYCENFICKKATNDIQLFMEENFLK